MLRNGARKVFQCSACRHQASLIAGTLFQGTKLPLTTWFLAIYLISQAKTGLSTLALKRHLGVSYPTAWLIRHKLMQAMAEREQRYVLGGKVQVDDAYMGGERSGGKAGRGSENKVAIVAAVSLTEENHPLRVRLSPVTGCTLKAVVAWAKETLPSGTPVFSDGLACFGAVADAGCTHHPTVMAGRKPRDVPEFKWINTVLGNLKTSLSGCYHAFDFQKYAQPFLAAFVLLPLQSEIRPEHAPPAPPRSRARFETPHASRHTGWHDVHCQSGSSFRCSSGQAEGRSVESKNDVRRIRRPSRQDRKNHLDPVRCFKKNESSDIYLASIVGAPPAVSLRTRGLGTFP